MRIVGRVDKRNLVSGKVIQTHIEWYNGNFAFSYTYFQLQDYQ